MKTTQQHSYFISVAQGRRIKHCASCTKALKAARRLRTTFVVCRDNNQSLLCGKCALREAPRQLDLCQTANKVEDAKLPIKNKSR